MVRNALIRVSAGIALAMGCVVWVGCANSQKTGSGNIAADTSSQTTAEPTAVTPAPALPTGAVDAQLTSLPPAGTGTPPPAPASPSPEALASKKVCPNCGATNVADAKVCTKCGHKLD